MSAQNKKIILTVYNRASENWRIKPATVEESSKQIQKYKMDVWYNVNIASASDFQITCYMQYQLHKVFPSVLTKAGRRAPETLLTKSLLLKLFNILKMSLQEIQFWLWSFNLGKIFCPCLEARNLKISQP